MSDNPDPVAKYVPPHRREPPPAARAAAAPAAAPPTVAAHSITVNGHHLQLSNAEIASGTLQAVPGRTNGDVELIVTRAGQRISLHVHPTAGSNSTPTGGGSALNNRAGAVPGNVPQTIVARIALRADYVTVTQACKPAATGADSGSWRKRR